MIMITFKLIDSLFTFFIYNNNVCINNRRLGHLVIPEIVIKTVLVYHHEWVFYYFHKVFINFLLTRQVTGSSYQS